VTRQSEDHRPAVARRRHLGSAGSEAHVDRKGRESVKGSGPVQQIEDLPEWARQGASHSQIAKDHADSPFFGLAFTMANTVDTKLMGLIKQAFDEMAGGVSQPAKGFEGALDPEEPGISDVEKERRTAFQHNRGMGVFALKHGEAEELTPLRWLMKSSDYLGSSSRTEPRARRAKKKGEVAGGPATGHSAAHQVTAKPDPRRWAGWKTGTGRDQGDWLSRARTTQPDVQPGRAARRNRGACQPGISQDHASHRGPGTRSKNTARTGREKTKSSTPSRSRRSTRCVAGQVGREDRGEWSTAAGSQARSGIEQGALLAEIDQSIPTSRTGGSRL
jgi:hypothetical protein